jgi:hypothetical protein
VIVEDAHDPVINGVEDVDLGLEKSREVTTDVEINGGVEDGHVPVDARMDLEDSVAMTCFADKIDVTGQSHSGITKTKVEEPIEGEGQESPQQRGITIGIDHVRITDPSVISIVGRDIDLLGTVEALEEFGVGVFVD